MLIPLPSSELHQVQYKWFYTDMAASPIGTGSHTHAL